MQSWNQWPVGVQTIPTVPAPAAISVTSGVDPTKTMQSYMQSCNQTAPQGYTPEQWVAAQQQHYAQWQQWQQQYQQWEAQYGKLYQETTNQTQSTSSLPASTQQPPLPPKEAKPPLPSSTTSNSIHEFKGPVFANNNQTLLTSTSTGSTSYGYSTTGPILTSGSSSFRQKQKDGPDFETKTALDEVIASEKKHKADFEEMEKSFQVWKEKNANHPDQNLFKLHEANYMICRTKYIQKLESLKRKREKILAAMMKSKQNSLIGAGDSGSVRSKPDQTQPTTSTVTALPTKQPPVATTPIMQPVVNQSWPQCNQYNALATNIITPMSHPATAAMPPYGIQPQMQPVYKQQSTISAFPLPDFSKPPPGFNVPPPTKAVLPPQKTEQHKNFGNQEGNRKRKDDADVFKANEKFRKLEQGSKENRFVKNNSCGSFESKPEDIVPLTAEKLMMQNMGWPTRLEKKNRANKPENENNFRSKNQNNFGNKPITNFNNYQKFQNYNHQIVTDKNNFTNPAPNGYEKFPIKENLVTEFHSKSKALANTSQSIPNHFPVKPLTAGSSNQSNVGKIPSLLDMKIMPPPSMPINKNNAPVDGFKNDLNKNYGFKSFEPKKPEFNKNDSNTNLNINSKSFQPNNALFNKSTPAEIKKNFNPVLIEKDLTVSFFRRDGKPIFGLPNIQMARKNFGPPNGLAYPNNPQLQKNPIKLANSGHESQNQFLELLKFSKVVDYAHKDSKLLSAKGVFDYQHGKLKPALPVIKDFKNWQENEKNIQAYYQEMIKKYEKIGGVWTTISPSKKEVNKNSINDNQNSNTDENIQNMTEGAIETMNIEDSTIATPDFRDVDELLSSPGRQARPTKIVVILRGPPGSGKSYIDKLIKDEEVAHRGCAPIILSLDDYFLVEKDSIQKNDETADEIEYEHYEAMESECVSHLKKTFKKNIADGYVNFIIIDDCINEMIAHYEDMCSFANSNGFQVYISEIHKPSENEINRIIDYCEPTPVHHHKLDVSSICNDENEEIKVKWADLKEHKNLRRVHAVGFVCG